MRRRGYCRRRRLQAYIEKLGAKSSLGVSLILIFRGANRFGCGVLSEEHQTLPRQLLPFTHVQSFIAGPFLTLSLISRLHLIFIALGLNERTECREPTQREANT